MANSFYTHGTVPQTRADLRSFPIRNEFDQITLAFNRLPALTLANANKALIVNSTGDGVTLFTGLTIADTQIFTTQGSSSTTFAQQASNSYTLPTSNMTWTTTNAARPYIWGLTLSNNVSDPTNDIDIAPGFAMIPPETEDTAGLTMQERILTSTLTKRLDDTYTQGHNGGGRATAATLADGTWYVFLVAHTSGTDVMFDNTPEATNVKAESGVTHARRIGSILRASGAILPFIQKGNKFMLTTLATGGFASLASDAASSAGVVSLAPTLPNSLGYTGKHGVIVLMKLYHRDLVPAGAVYLRFSGWQQTDITSNATTEDTAQTVTGVGQKRSGEQLLYIPAVSSSSTMTFFGLRYRMLGSSGNTVRGYKVLGWIDYREPTMS